MYVHIRRLTIYKEMPLEPPWNHPYNTDVFSLSAAWSHPAQHGNQERACVSSVFPLRPGNIHPIRCMAFPLFITGFYRYRPGISLKNTGALYIRATLPVCL